MSSLMQEESRSPATTAFAIALGENCLPERATGQADEHLPQSWQALILWAAIIEAADSGESAESFILRGRIDRGFAQFPNSVSELGQKIEQL